MKPRSPHSGLWAVGLAILALFAAAQDCVNGGNISPKSPEIQQPLASEGLSLAQYLIDIGALPREKIAPWIVQPSSAPFSGGVVTFQGYGPSQTNLRSDTAPVISLVEIQPNGCNKGYSIGRELGTTTIVENENNWTISNIEIQDQSVIVIGAVVKWDGNTGPPSNVLVFNQQTPGIAVSQPKLNEQTLAKVDFVGKAPLGLCIELWRGEEKLRAVDVTKDKTWKAESVRVYPGENIFRIEVALPGTSDENKIVLEHKIQGPTPPEFTWPFGKMDGDKYIPDETMGCITAWFGSNDFYMTDSSVKNIAFHDGLDVSCKDSINKPPKATPTPDSGGTSVSEIPNGTVRAIASGTVYMVDDVADSNGKYVGVDHGTWASLYLHLESIDKSLKDTGNGYQVQAGTPIGIMGKTGKATGVHLHLVGFWWPADKEAAKKTSYLPTGAILINLNPSNISQCSDTSYTKTHDIDWSYYWLQFTNNVKLTNDKETWTGTSFKVCEGKDDKDCVCKNP